MFFKESEIFNLLYKKKKIRVEVSIDDWDGAKPVKVKFLDIQSVLIDRENVDKCLEFIENNTVYLEYGNKKYTLIGFLKYLKRSYKMEKYGYNSIEMYFSSIIDKEIISLKSRINAECFVEIAGFDNWFHFGEGVISPERGEGKIILNGINKTIEELNWKSKNIKITLNRGVRENFSDKFGLKKTFEYRYFFKISSLNINSFTLKKVLDIANKLKIFITILTRRKDIFVDRIYFINEESRQFVEYHDWNFRNNIRDNYDELQSLVFSHNFDGLFLHSFKKFFDYYRENQYIVNYLMSNTLFNNPSVFSFLHLFNGLEVVAENDDQGRLSNEEKLNFYLKKFDHIKIFKNWEQNSARMAEARNFYTHGNKNKNPLNGDDEYPAVVFMRCLLEHIFLNRIGFSKDKLKRLWVSKGNKIKPMYWNYVRSYPALENYRLK